MSCDRFVPSGFRTRPGRTFTSHEDGFRTDPHRCYDALRSAVEPACNDDYGCRVFTRYDDVHAALKKKTLSVDARRSHPDSYMRRVAGTGVRESIGDTAYEPPLVLLDDPEHRRIRQLVSRTFNPKRIDAMRDRIQTIARELIDNLGTRTTIDFIADFAGPLPTMVILDMMGMPTHRFRDFKRWSEDVLWGYDPERSEARQRRLRTAFLEMGQEFRTALEQRRKTPGNDLLSAMIAGTEHGGTAGGLNELQIISLCTQLMVAGNVTTTDLIGNGMFALLNHPAQLAWLRAHPDRLPDAVEEMLRYDCPITETARFPTIDTVVGGCAVHAGDTLMLSLAAANHDGRRFADPHDLDLSRGGGEHVAFGSGVHVCLGAPLARLESRIAFREFLDAFDTIALDDERPPLRRALPFFRGFEVLPLSVRQH